MTPRCAVCSEENVEAGHEQSQRHLKNELCDQLAKNKKLFAENRNGIVVTCSVRPVAYNAEPLLVDAEQSLIKLSVKPREGVAFTFTVRNNNDTEIIFSGISTLTATQFNFTLLNDNLDFGTTSHRILPGTCWEDQVRLTFENNIVGVYKQPVYFIFSNTATDETTVILKELLVFVEAVKRQHEKVDSPYGLKPVLADKTVRTTARKNGDADVFVIPSKELKRMFARDLKTEGEGITDEEKALAEKAKAIFAAGPVEYNYIQFFHHLLWYEETVIASNLKNYNMSGVKLEQRTLSGKSYSLLVPGLAEKRPSLMLGDLVHVKPSNQTAVLYEAVITDIHDNYAQIGGLGATFSKNHYTPEAKFDIRFFMSRMPLERMHAAVDNVRRDLATIRTFPKGNERPPRIAPITSFYNPLVAGNPEQRAVVEHIVSGSSGTAPYLLHGPPGTGKTVTIVEAILQLVKNTKNRILVCTDSNMAADHVATLLIPYVDKFPQKEFMLRANSEYRVWETMPEILEPFSNGTKRANHTNVTIGKFMKYSIVITTLIHAAKFAKELQKKKHQRVTTHVFIDEAAQASEPACLIPVCGLLTPGGALVLAGDPKQLGPVVISREAGRLGLGISLMERLQRDCHLYGDAPSDPNYTVMLKRNFRSHRDILSIPDELFYNNQLESLAPPDNVSNWDILGESNTSRAIGFYGVQSQEQRVGKSPSFYNSAELEIIQSHITALLGARGVVPRVSQTDIGIITPYIRQVYKLKKWLLAMELSEIEVGTVEGFQGKEKRVILVSTVRANCDLFAHDAKFRLGFLVDPKRFNVALTRAKAKLIVIGHPTVLQKDAKWRRYIAKCREFGTYCGYDAGPAPDAPRDAAVDQISRILQLTRVLERIQV